MKRMSTVNATPARGGHGAVSGWAGGKWISCEPESAMSRLTSLRKGEGAFRLRPREPLPPRPLDKYQLRETKRRLLQRLGGGRLTPRACAHWFPLRQDPFCGKQKPGTPSCQPVSAALGSLGPQPLSALCPAPGHPRGVGGGLSRSCPTFLRACSQGYSFSLSPTSTAACQPLRPPPCGTSPDASPLWLQWLPQPQLWVRPRRRRRPQPRRAPMLPLLRAARVSLHQWGGCGPHCCLQAEVAVALDQAPCARWTPQQDWRWARRYGLPYVLRVDLSRVVPAPPATPIPTLAPARNPGPISIPKQALAFAPFSPPKRLRLVVSHGSIDLDVNS